MFFRIVPGEKSVSVYTYQTEHELLADLNQSIEDIKPEYLPDFRTLDTKITDMTEWQYSNKQLIISGQIVVPKPIQVTTQYTLS